VRLPSRKLGDQVVPSKIISRERDRQFESPLLQRGVHCEEDALTEEEAAEGLALACQTRPRTDLVVAIAASSAACKTGGQTYCARLHSVDRLSGTTIAFSLDRTDQFTFLPGQYVNVLVPGTDQRRSYSFSSPPGAEALCFLVRNIPTRGDEYLSSREGCAWHAGRVHRPGR